MSKKTEKTVDPELAERFMRLFAGLEGVHGTHGTPYLGTDGVKWAIKKVAQTVREPVTLDLVQQHLTGRRPLGVVPINAENKSVWGSIDVDDYEVDPLEIVAKIEAAKLPLLPGRSKSGGLHLYIFMKEPVPAADVRAALSDVAASLGLGGSEIFPKQTQILTDRSDHGSWIILPYFGDDYGGRIKLQHGLKKTGAEMTLSEFLNAADKMKVAPDQLSLVRVKKPKKNKPPFSDGPPCLQHLADVGVSQGGQNNTAFQMGVYFKRAHPEDWQQRLEDANQKFMRPPLPSDNLASVIRSLDKKDYQYKCKDQPMVNHCDSMVCRGRKFGVGAGGTYPEIRGLAKLNTEPAVWFVDVEESRIAMNTRELQTYPLFHALCMEHAHRCYKQVRQDLWLMLVSEAMESMELIEAPPDVGTGGVFLEILEDFLTNNRRGEKPEDVLSGRPWEDVEAEHSSTRAPNINGEARHYFRLSDLMKHLVREGMKEVRRTDITERLKKLGGGADFFNIKGRGCNVWFVPSAKVQTMPELDTPKINGSHI